MAEQSNSNVSVGLIFFCFHFNYLDWKILLLAFLFQFHSNQQKVWITSFLETKANLSVFLSCPRTDIAKTIVVFDVRPWDDTTDLDAMEQAIRTIEIDGLLWGQARKVPVAFGISKLEIGCVIEDEKVDFHHIVINLNSMFRLELI